MYLASFTVALLVFLLVHYLAQQNTPQKVIDFYQKNMRASLFAGFLTMGSFLLSLKTGIVIKIKESVYDKEGYQKRVSDALRAGSNVTFYGPLRRLSRVLSAAVLSALTASLSQLTLGLWGDWRASASCLALAALAFTLLIAAFFLIQINLMSWFKHFDEDAKQAHELKLKNETKKS